MQRYVNNGAHEFSCHLQSHEPYVQLEREKSSNQLMQDSNVPSVNKIEVPLSVKKKKIPIKGPVKVRTGMYIYDTKSS